MKILSASQIKQVDAYTIEHEPVSSIDLMERASAAFANKIIERWSSSKPVKVFAGPGNNGGDALAVSRILSNAGFKVSTYFFNIGNNVSTDCIENVKRLRDCENVKLEEITANFTPPELTSDDIIIDGMFGTGVSRPLNGGFASVVKYLNASPGTIVSIDVPSGLMTEDNTNNVMNHIVRADYTYTFQHPKLSFFFSDNEQFVGEWEVLDIGLKDPGAGVTDTPYHTTEMSDVAPLIKKRSKFAYKGSVGHGSLVAGKTGMAGAAILAAKASLRTGIGKVTVRTPESNGDVMQVTVPEAVLDLESRVEAFSNTFDANDFDALAIGPGIGTSAETAQAFIEQIRFTRSPIVIDADAINILGGHRGWIQQLPKKCILTPHKGELFGLISTTRNCYDELERTRELAALQQVYIVIKGAYSAVCTPEGNVYFNTTGNPGMATAGSGDVLTGIILALVSQGYTQENACRLGVYLHGLAGDIAAERLEMESVMASDIIDAIPMALRRIKKGLS